MIPLRFRVGLFFKGLLLAGLAFVFVGLLARLLGEAGPRWWWQVTGTVVFGGPAVFLVRTARLAWTDALLGQAVRERGATALAIRRAGVSLRGKGGRFVEYLLWNPWPPLLAGRRYTVVFGRHSGVLVAPPELDEE